MYKIMHKNKIVALADDTCITDIMKQALCPACFVIGMPLHIWLDNRSVDIHRSHSRRLFKALRLKMSEDISKVIKVGHGVTITDNWWIQRSDEDLDYTTLKRYNEEIADIALFGSSDSDTVNREGYLELGTVGSYEKAWRFENDGWLLYKRGNMQELISEYFSYLFLNAVGFNVAKYEIRHIKSIETGLTSSYIISWDFTNNAEVDFEPFCNYYADNEDFDYILSKLPDKLVVSYVMLVFYDALLFNGDRHNQNIGVLRDSSTGEVLELSPSFDYNLGLISAGIPRISKESGNIFTECLLSNEVVKGVLRSNLPTRELINHAVRFAAEGTKKAIYTADLKYSLIVNYIIDTYDYIASALQ